VGILQEKIIRDCTSVPLKTGCERQSNYRLNKKANVIMTQCVWLCNEDGCNASSTIGLSSLIGLISLIVFVIVF